MCAGGEGRGAAPGGVDRPPPAPTCTREFEVVTTSSEATRWDPAEHPEAEKQGTASPHSTAFLSEIRFQQNRVLGDGRPVFWGLPPQRTARLLWGALPALPFAPRLGVT